MVLVKMLMEIDPLPMRGSLVMMVVMISPSRREVFPAEQLRRSPRLVPPRGGGVSSRKLACCFFLVRKTSYSRRCASKGCQGAHEVGGHVQGGRARAHPHGWWVAPLWYFFRPILFIYSEMCSREVSRLLEMCRIGL